MSPLLSLTIPKPPRLFQRLALGRARRPKIEGRSAEPGFSARALADADLARLRAFGSWQALSAELRERATAR